MAWPEVVLGQLVIPGDMQGTGHDAVLSEGVPPACHMRWQIPPDATRGELITPQ